MELRQNFMDSIQLKLRFSLLFIGLLISPVTWSAPDFTFGVGIDAMRFYYREFDDDDAILNTEKGVIPGLVLNAAFEWETWYTEFNYKYNTGKVEYDGQTQTGIPVITDTQEDIADVNLIAGRYFGSASYYRSSFYGGLGYYYWERDILPGQTVTGVPVGGLFETYEWSYALLGGKFSLFDSTNKGLLLDLRLQRMLDATMEVDFLGFNNWDNLELDLSEEWSFRIGLPYILSTKDNARLTIEPYLITWFIGRSPDKQITSGGVPTGFIAAEPRSETYNFGLTVKYLFQL
jgi:hypothetical protein